MTPNQANWKPASGDMTENTDGSLYVSFQNLTLKARSAFEAERRAHLEVVGRKTNRDAQDAPASIFAA
jgi:hypothetical protein